MRVSDKVVLVTGGAGGIGAACADRLVREGAIVFASDVQPEPAEPIPGCTYLAHDVSDLAAWQCAVADIVGRHGRIDALVHCAGIEGSSVKRGLDTTEEDWARVIAVNLTGTFYGCKAVMPEMLRQRTGSIILTASANTAMATPQALAYGTSKAGVAHLARSVAVIGARGARVRCNSIHPGSIRTRMSDDLFAALASAASVPVSTIEERVNGTIPLGERGEPEDVASLVVYLASDESRYATGQAFTVDGGWSIRAVG